MSLWCVLHVGYAPAPPLPLKVQGEGAFTLAGVGLDRDRDYAKKHTHNKAHVPCPCSQEVGCGCATQPAALTPMLVVNLCARARASVLLVSRPMARKTSSLCAYKRSASFRSGRSFSEKLSALATAPFRVPGIVRGCTRVLVLENISCARARCPTGTCIRHTPR